MDTTRSKANAERKQLRRIAAAYVLGGKPPRHTRKLLGISGRQLRKSIAEATNRIS